MIACYFTGIPFLGALLRLCKCSHLNSCLTVMYSLVYWMPYMLIRVAYVNLFYGRRRAIFKRRQHDFVSTPEAYTYDEQADLYRSEYELDSQLEEWGWAEYLDIVYHVMHHKYNDAANFKQNLFPLLQELVSREEVVFRVLDIGQGPGNSTLDIRRAVENCEICCLDISEKLIRKAQRVVPDAYFFKGSMMDTKFLDASFNVVLNVGGINETDISTSLQETWRVAKDDSLIVIADENFDAKSYAHKMLCVLGTNMTFMDSYKYDGSSTRCDKQSIHIVDEFVKARGTCCKVIKRMYIPGLIYVFCLRKCSAKRD